MTHPSTRRASADIDCAATAEKHLPELVDLFKRLRKDGFLSKADRQIADEAVALMKTMAARLMLRNGVGLKQEELFGREGDCRPAPAEDPQRALEQAR